MRKLATKNALSVGSIVVRCSAGTVEWVTLAAIMEELMYCCCQNENMREKWTFT